MKLEVIVRIDGRERTLDIPCGLGDKSFKWLGQVASQRYANAAPNGTLRRREGSHGMSDTVQYQTMAITLPGGESPFPADNIRSYLRDGDSVIIDLCSKLNINGIHGAPQTSEYATLAYSVSAEAIGIEDHPSDDEITPVEFQRQRAATMRAHHSSHTDLLEETNSQQNNKRSKANFMRVIARSQMLNEKKIESLVADLWSTMQPILKISKTEDSLKIKQIFSVYWDILKEMFQYFSSDSPTMIRDQYIQLMEDANVFPLAELMRQSSLAFDRALKHQMARNGEYHALTFSSFLLSLIFCAQLKYNDTLDSKIPTAKSYDAVKRLVVFNFLPIVRRLDCRSLLRTAFVHDDCLSKLRDHYEMLQSCFGKVSTKSRDFPTTISVEDVTELLFQAELVSNNTDHTLTKRLLDECREGTIYGRYVDMDPSEIADYPDSEFTVPEFIEVVCRAGYYHFSKNPQTLPQSANSNDAFSGQLLSVASANNLTMNVSTADVQSTYSYTALSDGFQSQMIEFFLFGILSLCDFITGKKVKPPPTAKEGKRKK
jgi:hypothetical protein